MEVVAKDSLSSLPDEIVHHILSLLQGIDIARFKALSRRLRTLCITAPSLSYVDPRSPYADCGCLCMNCFNLMNTIPQLRPNDLAIHKLSFTSSCKRNEHRSLHEGWINNLFQTFRVDEFFIHYQLPSIFQSLPKFQSLKVLTLKMRGLAAVNFSEMKLTSLETLFVQNIYTEDSVNDWISQSFPSLKCLTLSHINAARQLDLSIQSSCLEDLTIQYCCPFKVVRIITENLLAFNYAMCYSRDCGHNYEMVNKDDIVIEMCAPNLQSLSWKGTPARLCYDAKTFKSLQKAVVTQIRLYNLDLLILLFEAIHWATSLHIDTHVLEDLYGKPSIPFENVRHLKICVEQNFWYHRLDLNAEEYYNNVGDDLITFLKRKSNLETLTLVSKPLTNSEEGHREYDALKEYFKEAVRLCEKSTTWKDIKGVKKVKFVIGSMPFSMALLIGILKILCVDLEEMTLVYNGRYDERLEHYLNRLKSASSTLSINLVPKRDSPWFIDVSSYM